MKFKSLSFGFSLLILLSACQGVGLSQPINVPEQTPKILTVFTAASLIEAFADVGAHFEAQHPDVEIQFNFAGSQQLAQQLAHGAPADVFASANQRQMQAAIDAGRVDAGTERVFAHNRLVVIYPRDNPGGIRAIQDLSKPGLRLDLAAEAVPVGYYSMQFLEKASRPTALGDRYREDVLENVVSYEENVRAVLSKVLLGEVDAGIVYASDISTNHELQLSHLDIPASLNVSASYYIAPLENSAYPELADTFMAYVLSYEGQKILSRYGLVPVDMDLMEASN